MKQAVGVVLWMLLVSGIVRAQTCTLPNNLTNGSVADATQVMANFDALLNCVNANGSVGGGIAGQLGTYSADGNAVSGESLSNLLDSAVGSAQGAILYRSSSGWVVLPPGTSGYVLQTGGASGNPSWAPPGGGAGSISTIIGAGVSSSASTVALPVFPVISRPPGTAFTWVNQASATITDNANGPLTLQTTQNTGTSTGINALIKNVAGSDWTVTIEYALGDHIAGTGTDLAGLVVYNSTSGRLYVCGLVSGNIVVDQYNSSTSLNGQAASKAINVTTNSVWARAQYASSTASLTFSYSIDGFTWETVYSTSAPFIGVPTNYGIAVGTEGNTSGYVLSLNYMVDSSP